MLHVWFSSWGEIVVYHIVWQDHFGDRLTVYTGHILQCVRHPTSGCDVYKGRTRAIAEQLSSTSKQFMPQYLELSGCHFRKVKSYTLHPRGFLLVLVVRSLFYFIHTVQNKNVIKYSSKTPISNVVIYLHFI